jgi:hypothetical protein
VHGAHIDGTVELCDTSDAQDVPALKAVLHGEWEINPDSGMPRVVSLRLEIVGGASVRKPLWAKLDTSPDWAVKGTLPALLAERAAAARTAAARAEAAGPPRSVDRHLSERVVDAVNDAVNVVRDFIGGIVPSDRPDDLSDGTDG